MGSNSSIQIAQYAGEDYVRCRVLGKGAFGKVYAVQHMSTGKFRVVKEMHKGTILTKGKVVVQLLIAERRFLSKLQGCPYVVKCFASTQDEKYLYMLLEFCSGGEVDFHLQRIGRFDEKTIKSYIAQITVALDYMHNNYHVVHRDLKPENVLLDEFGYCAIVDFNMAAECDDDFNIPNPSKHVIGTLPYIAPELLQGKDHNYKVDWWSLGIMIYEFSHGRRPYSSSRGEGNSDKKKLMDCIKNTKLNEILSNDISDELKSIIIGLLEKDPNKRWSANEIKTHKLFRDYDWDNVLKKKIEAPILPRDDKVNFKADANVEEVFGIAKPKDVEISEEEQKCFEGWNWNSDNQELPPPIPTLVVKAAKKKKIYEKKQEKKLAASNETSIKTSLEISRRKSSEYMNHQEKKKEKDN